MNGYEYTGNELDTFAQAVNWKRYFGSKLRPWLRGDVLEVGAGLGGTTRMLYDGRQQSWTCLEPDARLAERISADPHWQTHAPAPDVIVGNLAAIEPGRQFDAILYIDVLEHIECDGQELKNAAALLKSLGTLIVLSPAQQFLYSKFDEAIGHYRRYTRASLTRLTPEGLNLERTLSLDSAGMMLSLANRWLLCQSAPTLAQVRFWDNAVVPVSRWLDACLGYRIGKSIIAVWRKPSGSVAAEQADVIEPSHGSTCRGAGKVSLLNFQP